MWPFSGHAHELRNRAHPETGVHQGAGDAAKVDGAGWLSTLQHARSMDLKQNAVLKSQVPAI